MSIAKDRFEEMETSSDEFPEAWIFNGPDAHGRSLVGEFVRLERATTRFGDSSIVVLRLKDGSERSVWLLWAALRSQFRQARPKPGELIKVSFHGEKISAAGNTYLDYRVRVQRDQELSWDDIIEPGDDGEFGDWGVA